MCAVYCMKMRNYAKYPGWEVLKCGAFIMSEFNAKKAICNYNIYK